MNNATFAAPPVLHVELTFDGVLHNLPFNAGRVRIGRFADSCKSKPELAVKDPAVSREQAVIEWRGKNYWVADANSLSGTFYNGERLSQGEWRPLTTGVKLAFGRTTAVIRIERAKYHEYDVFLCHSHADKQAVRDIAHALRASGINPWHDEDELTASVGFIGPMCDALRTVGVAAVIWGPGSPGRWQTSEIEYLQKVKIEQNVRLVPIILPGVTIDPEWPVFMDLLQRIDFRKPKQDAMKLLIDALKTLC